MTYTVSQNKNVVTVVVSGPVTLEECVRSVDGLLGEATLRPGMQLVLDAGGLKPRLSSDDLRDLASRVKTLGSSGLDSVAIIAPSDFVYGLARAFSTYAGIQGFNIAAFRTHQTARGWLQTCRPSPYPPAQANLSPANSSAMTREAEGNSR